MTNVNNERTNVITLVSCPFCGGEAHTVVTSGIRAPWGEVALDGMGCTVVCEDCGATVPSLMTEAEAIEAWNTRAKPTWRELRGIDMDYVRDLIERHSDEGTGGNSRDFHNGAYAAIAEELNARAERTCKAVLSSERDGMPYLEPQIVCSECGCILHESRFGVAWQRYCPNCGAKVAACNILESGQDNE